MLTHQTDQEIHTGRRDRPVHVTQGTGAKAGPQVGLLPTPRVFRLKAILKPGLENIPF